MALLANGPAHAQSVDYGTLEQIFGEPITTSATGKPQRASEVPADMTIITQDDIRRSGADNIPDILQFVAGIDMRRYSFGDAEIAIHGYNTPDNPRLLVLVDGRQIYSDDYGLVLWNAIPVQLSEIRQIEIVRGPNTALFGFNAASGVINIITFDPLLDNRNSVVVRAGTQGYGESEAVVTQHIGTQSGVRVSLGGWTSTGYAGPDPGSAPPLRYGSFNLDGRWQVMPSLLVNASGGATSANAVRNLGLFAEVWNRISYERIGAVWQAATGTIDFDLYHNQSLNSYQYLGAGDNNVDVARVSDLLKIDAANTIRVGLEFRRNSLRSDGVGGTISYDVLTADGIWDWQISPMVEWTNAVRIDDLSLHYDGTLIQAPGRMPADFNTGVSAVSFNSGLVVRVSDVDTVRLTASRGLQLPSLIDYGVQINDFGLLALGSPRVLPESVWNGELAYDRAMAWFGGTLRVSVFFQRNTDLVAGPGSTTIGPLNGRLTSIAGNVGSSNEIGTQIELQGATQGGLRWNVSYRYTTITDDLNSRLADTPTTAYDVGTPHHVVTLGAGYTVGRWEFDARARGQTGFSDYAHEFMRETISDYVSFSATAGFRLTPNVLLQGTAAQFNVTRILEGAGSYVDRRLVASARVEF